MPEKTLPTAGVKDVMKTFWRAIKPQQVSFYIITLMFLTVGGLVVTIPLFYKKFFDLITTGGDKATIAPQLTDLIVTILLINVGVWVAFRIGAFLLTNFESKVMARLKQMSFEYLIDHSYGFFSNTFTGALVQRVNRLSRGFERLFDTFVFNFMGLFVSIVGVVIVVFGQNVMIAWIIMAWVVVTGLVQFFFSRWKLKYDLAASAADSATTARLADTISNQNAVASFSGSDYESEAFKKVSNDQARAARFSWNLSSLLDSVQAAFIMIMEFFIFYYAIKFWQQDAITVGTFVLIQVYIIGLAAKLWDFNRIIRNTYESFADSEEMVGILVTPHEIKDVPRAKPLAIKNSAIELNDISFSFDNTHATLSHLNLSIRGGEKIALIGPSGAGKSTLVKLILRLYNLKEGKILIDGQDIQKVTQDSLRDAISLVPQDPVLFHRTLMENIRYGRRDATDEEVIAAARLAHCDDFIENLPLKYNTFVGERGIKLSGGERQRVAIARAILKNAPILILDEATSSLDSHSEAMIQDALNELMKNKTTIVIAHRLSTIKKMDRIIVLENGSIIEQGSHDDLVAKEKSLYKLLWNLQAGGFLRT